MAPMLGLAGGMMLAASFFSLLVPATGIVAASTAPLPLALLTAGALLAGGALMQAMDRRFPHAHVETLDDSKASPRLALVVVAIALHNLPEGLAVGVAAAARRGTGICNHVTTAVNHTNCRGGSWWCPRTSAQS